MGLDFSALIHYSGLTDNLLEVITHLEAGHGPPELERIVELGRRLGFAFANHSDEVATWRAFPDWEQVLPGRPALPSLRASLDLPSGFGLMFGAETVWVHHMLRWIFFVTEDEWQRVMLGAVRWFCRSFDAIDCIIVPDEHPAVLAFRSGSQYRDALQVAADRGEGEVSRINDLFIDKGYDDQLVLLGPGGVEEPASIWETHGFWRFNFRAGDPAGGPGCSPTGVAKRHEVPDAL